MVKGDLRSAKSPIAASTSSNVSSATQPPELRFRGDHRVPVGPRVEVAEQRPAPVAQNRSTSAGSNAVPRRVRGDGDGRVEAAAAMEHRDHVGEIDQP